MAALFSHNLIQTLERVFENSKVLAYEALACGLGTQRPIFDS